jgi:hypothetical protein
LALLTSEAGGTHFQSAGEIAGALFGAAVRPPLAAFCRAER